MHNFLISVAGSFVGIGLLLAFTVIINLFLEEGEDLENVVEINELWLAVIELEEKLAELQNDFNDAIDAAE